MTGRGVSFGAGLPVITEDFQPTELLDSFRSGEEGSLDSLWVADHLSHFPNLTVAEAWTALTAGSVVTNRVSLGTCVTDPHRYHPAVLAQRLATIDRFSGGRVILGLGAGAGINLDPFNIQWNKPVSRLAEFVEVVRKLWTGETFTHQGEFWSFDGAFLQIRPVQARLPIYLAANSPRTLRLTGEIADGWLPLGLTPGMYKKRLKLIREAATGAGRNPDEIDAGLYIALAIADRPEDAYANLEVAKSFLIAAALEEAGYKLDLPDHLKSYSYLDWQPTIEAMELRDEYARHFPNEALRDFCIVGTPQECIERIEEFVEAGVRHFVLEILGKDHRSTVERCCKEVIPYFSC